MRRALGVVLVLAVLGLPAGADARPRAPVVMVVFDELPTTSLLGKGRRIDRVRYPNFAALAGDATWFRNATTVHDSTFAAIPGILDGRNHRYVVGRRVRAPRRSLLAVLARRGYRVRASVEAGGVCARRFCGRVRGTRYYLVRSRLARFAQFVDSIRPSVRPTIYLKHTLLPHVPWAYLPSGRQYLHGPYPPIRGINSALVRDPVLARLAWQRHLLQVGAVDRLIGRLVRRLKRVGLYDRTLIVITADHGISFRAADLDRRAVTRANVQGVAPVPLLVKRPGQRHGGVSRSYARTLDVAPTVASILRLPLPWRTRGRSAFSRAVRRRHGVRVGTRIPKVHPVKVGARSFQRRWRAVIRAKLRLFGFGRRGPGLYGTGPNRRLLGRVVRYARGRLTIGRTRVRRAGRIRGRLVRPGDFRLVGQRSSFRPAFVAGRIRGGRRRSRRALAIVVNGRIRAVTRSFRLGKRRRELFAALVPESAFQPGRNTVAVLAVGRRRGRLRFRVLAGA